MELGIMPAHLSFESFCCELPPVVLRSLHAANASMQDVGRWGIRALRAIGIKQIYSIWQHADIHN